MKKFSILSGAYINAGDFLIVKRTEELIKYVYPNCKIKKYERNKEISQFLDEINESDALIIAGGPAYTPNMYPDVIKLVDDLSKITTKIIPIGVGWYGKKTDNDFLYSYKFNDKSKKLLNKIYNENNIFGCRDWYSANVLSLNGYSNCIMTGCPAWYNIEKVNLVDVNLKKEINKICISDPANKLNFYDAISLVDYLKNKFPKSEIDFVFHRIDSKNNKYLPLIKYLEKNNIKIVDITGNFEGFKIYDDCDLHIGFRVHAHIYNLSNRNLSILVEEDGRGSGVNEALGLQGFKSIVFSSVTVSGSSIFKKGLRYISTKINYRKNKKNYYLIKNIDNYLNVMRDNNFIQHEIAFNNMKKYFSIMIDYIKSSIEGK